MDAGNAAEVATEVVHLVSSPLPAALVLGPLVAAVLVRPVGKRWPQVRNVYMVVVTALTLLGAAGLIPLVAEHHRIQSVVPALLASPQRTAREREILDYLAQGLSNKAIARILDISHDTVKLHVRHILSKLNLTSRVEAAVFVIEHKSAQAKKQ